MPKATKKLLTLTAGLFLLLLIFLSAHNLRTLLTGANDKIFYFFFIIFFFLTPAVFLLAILSWLGAVIKNFLARKKKEYERRLIEEAMQNTSEDKK